jgi:hypothetical protein
VVAADKGTATFSDIANGVAATYGFWLGDAFASGGSAATTTRMGITARGAWEAVKRHFRETRQATSRPRPFTVVGVGDMSGDVFGNGMLLSRTSACSPPSTTATSSSTRIPIRPAASPSASGCSRCRARRAGPTTTRR